MDSGCRKSGIHMGEFVGGPRIGFVTCVHPIYGLPSVMRLRDEAVSSLQAAGCEVVSAAIARKPEDVSEIAAQLKQGDVDLLLFFFCTWVAEEITLTLAREMQDTPLLLWALPFFDRDIPMPSPMTGLMATGCNLAQTGRVFLHRVGSATAETVREVARTARAAALARSFRKARFGVVGSPCPGMIDTRCDGFPVRDVLGIAPVQIGLEELILARDASSSAEAGDLAARLVSRTGSSEIPLDKIAEQYRLYLGLKAIAETHQVDAIAVRCWPELRDQHRNLICLALSEMAESGIPTACEADLTTLITSYLLTRLSGQPCSSLEITALLEDLNALQLAHCGVAALSMAGDRKHAAVRSHMRTGGGALVEFPFPPGTVTIAKLIRPSGDRAQLFVGLGDVIPTPAGVRGSVATVRVRPSPAKFLDALLKNAVEHHLVIVYGDWTEDLSQFARFSGIEIIKTSR
jgi:L-fucose isomerase-like protein